ncbi:dihydrodipicolinate synthase family protein [Campylobacter sp. RM12651]|uniref:dihydrodipicolinate synthase family protein n=1 Tax=Campylobacter sp. RM12651 TaxID=1660079 RepID=UPI001EFB38CB|nr:dihydrodipicolinate synthase family protein [Campylobacter sp. RM12651]ULO03227.1 2-keto-3-deoxygluconate aldolase [Campylobacter sp. RM12651]
MGILKGTLPALYTPYKDDGGINEVEFLKICEWGIEKGLDGLFCNGSAGDSQAMPYEMKVKMLELSIKAANNKVPVICGIGSCIYKESLDLANEAYIKGANALLLMMPYYYKFNDDTIYTYVKDLQAKVKLPLYIYNIPLFAPAMSLNLIEKLSKLPNIVGIKDSSGDALLLNHILDVVPSDFDVFVGREEHYFGALMMGAKGSMTSAGCVFPDAMSAIYKAYNEKNYERAIKLQKALLPAIRFGMSLSFPMGFALLLKARGFAFANKSIHPLSEETLKALDEKFEYAKELVKNIERIL